MLGLALHTRGGSGGGSGDNVANLYKTGVTTSSRTGDDGDTERGRGTDFFELSYTNPWGHTYRYCGNTGGYTDGTSYYDVNGVGTTRALAFPSEEVCDFAYYDQVNGTVPMWYALPFGTTTPSPVLPNGGTVGGTSGNAAIDACVASTQNSYTDWYLPNESELHSIVYRAQAINQNGGLDYPPFDYLFSGSPTASNWRVLSSSINVGNTRIMYYITENGSMSMVSPTTASYTYFMIRIADTAADLGL